MPCTAVLENRVYYSGGYTIRRNFYVSKTKGHR